MLKVFSLLKAQAQFEWWINLVGCVSVGIFKIAILISLTELIVLVWSLYLACYRKVMPPN